MPAMSGDLLGLMGVWMPSGFNVAVAPAPAPVDQHGPVGRRAPLRPAPTYHGIAVTSRIVLVAAARLSAFVPLAAEGVLEFAGRAEASALYLRGSARISTRHSVETAVESAIAFVGAARAMQYNERDVRFVLGLP